jgi:hypothetical protein
MYSLAILAARAVLVDADAPLAIVADELISLARQVALQHQPGVPLGGRKPLWADGMARGHVDDAGF